MTETHTYDPLQKPLTIQVKDNNHQLLMDRSYQYDKAENITKRSSEEGTTQYTYDLLDRLTTAIPSQSLQQKGLPIESYSYDAIANRTGSAHQPGDWLYNDKNQLIQWGNGNQQKTLTYTPNGHIATEKQANKILSYNYNAADRLTSIKNGTTQIASYQYDPFGRRISKTVNGQTTYYLYTAEGLLAELDQQGNLQVAYGWQPDTEFGTTPLWQANLTQNTTATLKTAHYHYLHTDHLGTVQLATDSTGQVTWKGNSEAFGKTILNPTNQITINLRFPGQYYDQETGTHYNYFRDYNPNIGRYNESDPIGLFGGINTYAYAYSNPNNYLDYLGLTAKCPKLPPENDPNWERYNKSKPTLGTIIFHCGFTSYVESRIPEPDNPRGECVYDNSGCLVDDNHEYSRCQGTPDQYSSGDPRHTLIDSGGILKNLGSAFESLKKRNDDDIKKHRDDRKNRQEKFKGNLLIKWGDKVLINI